MRNILIRVSCALVLFAGIIIFYRNRPAEGPSGVYVASTTTPEVSFKSTTTKTRVTTTSSNSVKSKPPSQITHSNKLYRLSVGSQVEIHVYDSSGSHTGIVHNTDPLTDLDRLDQQIPNTSYTDFGSRRYVTIYLGDNYKIFIRSQEADVFDVQLEQDSSGNSPYETIYSNIPIDLNGVVSFELDPNGQIIPLALDVDGDGINDVVIPKGETISKASLLDIIEYQVYKLDQFGAVFRKFDKKLTLGFAGEVLGPNDLERVETLWSTLVDLYNKGKISRDNSTDILSLLNYIKS